MLDDLTHLPRPQELALQVALGLADGERPDRFMVGLAVLGLLAHVSAKRPLVCLVDDAQWLDGASSQVLAFVGRRLLAEPVLLLVAVREAGDEQLFRGLPTLTIEGLTDADARALLTAVVSGQLDEQVRDRIVAETRGNPLALIELPRGMSQAELAGGFGVPHTGTLPGHIENYYLRRVKTLSEATQQLMLLAAADPTGDATLLWKAAESLGVPRSAASAAESDQLLEIGPRVRFRHPLVRSAAHAAGTSEDLCAAHLALAEATDPMVDGERRVWHLAAAATGPDEDVASALERAAGAAQARAGLAASAAFLQRSVVLTPDPGRRAERALAAAQAHLDAGTFQVALGLLAEADALAVNDVQRGKVERLRGLIQYSSNPGPEAPVRLLAAAKRLEQLDVEMARQTYLDAWIASFAAGQHALAGDLLQDVSKAARSAPTAQGAPGLRDLFLEGFSTVVTAGRSAGAPSLRAALDTFLGEPLPDSEWLRWGHLAIIAAGLLWDIDNWVTLSARHVEIARASGALSPLSIALNGRGVVTAWCGDFEATTVISDEFAAISEVTGIRWYSAGALLQAAYAGREPEAGRGEAQDPMFAIFARAILFNGLGRYADALAAAEQAAYEFEGPNQIWLSSTWALPELIEAAVRSGKAGLARDALRRLASHGIEGADWAGGLEARSRALVTDGADAERWYVEAVDRLSATPIRPELARAHLLYGEWLRRQGRRVDGRQQLRAAYDMFAEMGAEGFAERARRELLATGEKVRKRAIDTQNALTPQEEHIARLARDGRTNVEISAELFLSVRTVEWHLRKVFTKLAITTRRGLKDALPARGRYTTPE
jgi:DNA-binding CsgD family transcriptional regulator